MPSATPPPATRCWSFTPDTSDLAVNTDPCFTGEVNKTGAASAWELMRMLVTQTPRLVL